MTYGSSSIGFMPFVTVTYYLIELGSETWTHLLSRRVKRILNGEDLTCPPETDPDGMLE